MLEKFDLNKKYKFSKDSFFKIECFKKNYDNMPAVRYWVDLIDNCEVKIVNKHEGGVGDYNVIPQWCEEIE